MINWQPIETFPQDVEEFTERYIVVVTTHGRIVRACGSAENGEFCIHEMHDGFGINRLLKSPLETYLQSEHAQWEHDPISYWNNWEVATHWCEVTAPN